MIMHDINPDHQKVLLLIHPMLSSGQGLKICITDYLGDGYRYLLPDLAGHGDVAKKIYRSAKEEADQIHTYLNQTNCRHIQLGYGASLGSCVLFELMKYPDIHFENLFFEGTSFYEKAHFLYFLSRKIFVAIHRKAIQNPKLAVSRMTDMYGETAGKMMADCFIAIDEESLVHICYDCSHTNPPELTEAIQRRCVFAYGERDFDFKKGRKQILRKYPQSKLMVWPDMGHCEKISKEASAYAQMLKAYL